MSAGGIPISSRCADYLLDPFRPKSERKFPNWRPPSITTYTSYGPCWFCGDEQAFYWRDDSGGTCERCAETQNQHPLMKTLKLDLERIHG